LNETTHKHYKYTARCTPCYGVCFRSEMETISADNFNTAFTSRF